MKYQIVGIEHAAGEFTPSNGKNAGQVQKYDLYRLHTIKNSKIIGGNECVVIRATPDQMGQIVAECGGKIESVVKHVFDMEVRNSFGKNNLTNWEVVQ